MGAFKTSFFLITGILLLNGLLQEASAGPGDCACNLKYFSGTPGCIIAQPPMPGFKCRCRVGVLFFMIPHCVGTAIPCDAGESCPSACISRQCCIQGGGDCKGYDGVNSVSF